VTVLDSSAIVAILLKEPEATWLAGAIADNEINRLSAASLVEATIAIESRKGTEGARDLDLFIYRAGIEIVPVDREQAEVARVTWRKYGKGRHPAGLNFGDCFSYALAKVSGDNLLFKGNDFSETDLPGHPGKIQEGS
jgi:ribonuclease VapC